LLSLIFSVPPCLRGEEVSSCLSTEFTGIFTQWFGIYCACAPIKFFV
jgi:hypothetical protein